MQVPDAVISLPLVTFVLVPPFQVAVRIPPPADAGVLEHVVIVGHDPDGGECTRTLECALEQSAAASLVSQLGITALDEAELRAMGERLFGRAMVPVPALLLRHDAATPSPGGKRPRLELPPICPSSTFRCYTEGGLGL